MNKRSGTIRRCISSADAFSTPFQFGVGGRSRHKTVIGGLAALLAYAFLAFYFVTQYYYWKTDPLYTHSMIKSFRKDENKEAVPTTTFIPAVIYSSKSEVDENMSEKALILF